MRLRFLGTGAATSTTRCNVATLVNERLLVDAGAPLLTQLQRMAVDPDAIGTVLITHFHGDHLLGLPTFLIRRVLQAGPPLSIIGPTGIEECLERLCQAAWGARWRSMGPGFSLDWIPLEAGGRFEADGLRIEAATMEHDSGALCATPSLAYRIDDGEVRVGFTGDAAPGPWVDALVEGCDAALVECTAPDPGPTHLSHDYVRDLTHRHAAVRVVLHHFACQPPTISGATAPDDLTEVRV